MSHYSYKKVSNDNLSTVREMTNSIVHIDDFFFHTNISCNFYISLDYFALAGHLLDLCEFLG